MAIRRTLPQGGRPWPGGGWSLGFVVDGKIDRFNFRATTLTITLTVIDTLWANSCHQEWIPVHTFDVDLQWEEIVK